MATITACTAPSSSFARQRIVASPAFSVLGLPSIAKKGIVRCSMEQRATAEEASSSKVGMSASLLAAACAAATMSSPAAMALVDERMSTEGVGLPLGLSNNVIGWLILGVAALIWSLYINYASSLEEDEESGLSL